MTGLHRREDWTLFRGLEGTCQHAGCAVDELPWVVVKELVDNALDSAGDCRIEWPAPDTVVVSDQGEGIPGTDEEIAALFSLARPLLSSKIARRPTRGAMGNGLRVVVGTVYASGGALRITTSGRRLTLAPQGDGTTQVVAVDYRNPDGSPCPLGCTIEVRFGRSLAPHTRKARNESSRLTMLNAGPTYKGRPSPWWYDSESFYEFLWSDTSGQTVRSFVAKLDGLSSSAAGRVAANFNDRKANSLSFEESEALLSAAREAAKKVTCSRLGHVGPLEHTFPGGYAREEGEAVYPASRGRHTALVPFVAEVWAVPAKEPRFRLFINRSPVIGDRDQSAGMENKTNQYLNGCGLHHYFKVGRTPMSVTINVITPHVPLVTGGKKPDLTAMLRPAIFDAIKKAIRRGKAGIKGDSGQATQRSVIIDALPAATAKAGDGGYRFSLRQLFYAVRPTLIETFGKEPNYSHFSKVIARYEDKHGCIPRMYRDPRGVIYHPHRREEIPLGTLAVETYQRPEWTFNSVLYIEKEGYVAALREVGWPERNDCALMTGKGFASGAARDLIDMLSAADRDITFFCVHDADGPGTMIMQTLQEATAARRARRVKIVNLGLDPDEGEAMGLQVEKVNRKGKVPVADYITDPKWRTWLQTNRVELNAMTTGQFLAWLDRKIAPYLRGKVVPPAGHLQESLTLSIRNSLLTKLRNEAILEARVEERAEKALAALMSTVADMAPHLAGHVQQHLERHTAEQWSKPLLVLADRLASGDETARAEIAALVMQAPVVPDRTPTSPPARAVEDWTEEDEAALRATLAAEDNDDEETDDEDESPPEEEEPEDEEGDEETDGDEENEP